MTTTQSTDSGRGFPAVPRSKLTFQLIVTIVGRESRRHLIHLFGAQGGEKRAIARASQCLRWGWSEASGGGGEFRTSIPTWASLLVRHLRRQASVVTAAARMGRAAHRPAYRPE